MFCKMRKYTKNRSKIACVKQPHGNIGQLQDKLAMQTRVHKFVVVIIAEYVVPFIVHSYSLLHIITNSFATLHLFLPQC